MKEVFRYRGHRNLIHELSWSLNDYYLVSCSSDFTARVWKVPGDTNDEIDEDQSEREYLLSTLIHPSYVYSAKFHPKCSKADLYIATACFDSKVRIFYVNKKYRGKDETSKFFLNN
jgi:WD40 repeat protein